MKGFLLDENLPSGLQCSPGLPVIPFSQAGRHPGDSDLWRCARRHGLVIVSEDADFSDRTIMQSPPPWVVHLRFGSLKRKEFHARLARVGPQAEGLLKTHKLVNVYADRLGGIR